MLFVYLITQRIVWLSTKFFGMLFVSYSVSGRYRLLKTNTPLLIVSNHKSCWDSFIISTFMPFFSRSHILMGFMAADKFFNNPVSTAFLFLIGVRPSYKGRGMDTSLTYPRYILSQENGVFQIFPFGKILSEQEEKFLPFPGRGAATLVLETPRLTILPIYIQRSRVAPSFINILRKKERLHYIVGKPFCIENGKKNIDSISKEIIDNIFSLKESPS